MRRFMEHERARGFPWVNSMGITLCAALLFLWLLVKPADATTVLIVDSLAGTIFPAVAGGFSVWVILSWRRQHSTQTPYITRLRRSSLLIVGGVFGLVAGQIITIVYQVALQQTPTSPSWADVGFLSIYPCILLGIVLLPNAQRSRLAMTRFVADSLMILTALVTFSWFFILGPTMLQAQNSLWSRVVGTIYPLADLVVLLCLVLIINRQNPRQLRFSLLVFVVGLLIIVSSDTILDYETLHNIYSPGTFLDIGWMVGSMLVVWSAQMLFTIGQTLENSADAAPMPRHATPSLWRAILPYLFIPAVAVLFAFALFKPGDARLTTGVYCGGVILVILLIGRQFIAIRETVAFAREMQALHEHNLQLQALSTTDPLTNLPNHRALQQVLHKELPLASLQGVPLSIIMLDIDHFREFNEQHGHDVGDRVLQCVAQTIQHTIQTDEFVARYGGEEFTIVVRAGDEATIMQIAETIRTAIEATSIIVTNGVTVPITASLGFATFPLHASVASSLLKAADVALYAAKRAGRNQVVAYSQALLTSPVGDRRQPPVLPSEANLETVQALITAIDLRDGFTAAHSEGVARYAVAIATKLGLPPTDIEQLRLGGLIHDVGKIGVPDQILGKAGKLTAEEWQKMQEHTTMGAHVLQEVQSLQSLLPLVRWHHERLDGSGYPDGLAGDAIPYLVRILSVADVFEAFTAERPYHPGRTKQEGLDLLWSEARKGCLDGAIVRVLETIIEHYRIDEDARIDTRSLLRVA